MSSAGYWVRPRAGWMAMFCWLLVVVSAMEERLAGLIALGESPSWQPVLAVIDLDGDGLAFSDISDPVEVVVRPGGEPHRLSWTAVNDDDAFLWCDHDGDGRLQVAGELVVGWRGGQGGRAGRGPFEVLRAWERQSGDGNGRLDRHDAVFHKLGLWVDRDHDGVASRGELHTLAEHSIRAMALDPRALGTLDGSLNLLESEVRLEVKDLAASLGKRPTSLASRGLALVAVRFAVAPGDGALKP